jgi:hypothetical protein
VDTTRVKLRNPNYASKDSPFFMDRVVLQMRDKWEVMQAVTSGTEYLHKNAELYLPREPREEEGPWESRVNRSVLTPFVRRLISNAAGLVLRRSIHLEGGDPWWEETFRKDVDGDGTSLDQFAKKRLEVALTYGHCNMMVDAPRNTAANAAEEVMMGQRPYFVPIDPWQLLGWRRESDAPGAKLTMFRYQEEMKVPLGKFGEEYTTVARVIEPGRFSIYKDFDTQVGQEGTFDLDYVPVIAIYSDREGFNCSSPPLADVARLNITHFQRLSDLLHSLHIAAIGLLVLEDYDGEEGVTGLSYAIRMSAGSKAYWVQCDAGSFVAQADALDRLENQMSHLGVTKLLGQKFVAESADAKRIDQQQANSVMAVVSLELENALNEAFRMAGEYAGKEPPKVVIDKDFDYYRLLGQDVSVLGELEDKGQIRTSTFLKILRSGEWVPDSVDLVEEEAEIKRLKTERRQQMLQEAQASRPQDSDSESGAAGGGSATGDAA